KIVWRLVSSAGSSDLDLHGVARGCPLQYALSRTLVKIEQRVSDGPHRLDFWIAHQFPPTKASTRAGKASMPTPLARRRRFLSEPVVTNPLRAFSWLEKLAWSYTFRRSHSTR